MIRLLARKVMGARLAWTGLMTYLSRKSSVIDNKKKVSGVGPDSKGACLYQNLRKPAKIS